MKVKGEVATTGTFHIEMGPLSVQGLARFETGSPIATSSVPPEATERLRPSISGNRNTHVPENESEGTGQWSKDLSVAISGFEISALLADPVLFYTGFRGTRQGYSVAYRTLSWNY